MYLKRCGSNKPVVQQQNVTVRTVRKQYPEALEALWEHWGSLIGMYSMKPHSKDIDGIETVSLMETPFPLKWSAFN